MATITERPVAHRGPIDMESGAWRLHGRHRLPSSPLQRGRNHAGRARPATSRGSPPPRGPARRCALVERPTSLERRARWAVTTYFVISGLALAAWTARIPSIKNDLGLDDAQISAALFAVAAGSVLAMQVAGHLVDRVGSSRVLAPAGALVAVSLVLPGLATGLPTLAAGLLLFGVAQGLVDVAMNTHAVRVERHYRRPIMSTFHATFSLGGLAGAGLGALAAHLRFSPLANFAVVGIALGLLSVAARPHLLAETTFRPAAPPGSAPGKSRRRWAVPPAIAFLGALGFFCSVGEGSMTDWSSVYLHDELNTGPAVAPIGFAVFSTTMGACRLLGDRLALRFGPVALVRGCGTIAGTGLAVGLLLHHPVAAIIGFALFGIGLSVIVPQVFSAAGNLDPERSGRDLAQVSTLAYGGLLAGPVVIGLIAHRFGLTAGLAIPALLALLVAASASALRPRRAEPARTAGE